jgi:hypothetical protein
MIYTMTWSQFGVLAVALIGLVMLSGYIVQRRSGGTDRAEALQQVAGMQRLGRVVYWSVGAVAVVAGLVVSQPAAVLLGIASLLAGTGQHWAYKKGPRR